MTDPTASIGRLVTVMADSAQRDAISDDTDTAPIELQRPCATTLRLSNTGLVVSAIAGNTDRIPQALQWRPVACIQRFSIVGFSNPINVESVGSTHKENSMNRAGPQPGDLILVVRSHWSALNDGEWLRVCEKPYWGQDGKVLNVAPRSQVRVFWGPDHGPPDGISPEHMSSSGGPFRTVRIEDLVGLKVRCTAVDKFWCWKDRPRQGGGMERPVTVTIWCCQRLADSHSGDCREPPKVTWTLGSPTLLAIPDDTTTRPDSPSADQVAAPGIHSTESEQSEPARTFPSSCPNAGQEFSTPIRLGSTQKRVRQVRETGLQDHHVIRDWMESITSQDPGSLPERYRINGIGEAAECCFCGCSMSHDDDAWEYVGQVFCSISCCRKSHGW